MSIRRQLILINLSLTLFVVLVGGIGVYQAHEMEESFLTLAHDISPAQKALEQIRFAALRVVTSTADSAYTTMKLPDTTVHQPQNGSRPWMIGYGELIESGRSILSHALSEYERLANNDPVRMEFHKKIRETSEQLVHDVEMLVATLNSSHHTETMLTQQKILTDREQIFLTITDQAINHEHVIQSAQEQEVKETLSRTLYIIVTVTVTSCLVATALAYHQSRTLLHPLKALEKSAQALGRGNWHTRAPVTGNNELGSIGSAFNQMAEDLHQQAVRLIDAKEIAEKAYRAESEFIANMSHELRTPIHAILSFSQLGIKKIKQPDLGKTEDYLGRIHDSGERLLRLVNDLLDLSKLEAGGMRYDFVSSDLMDVVQQCLDEQSSRIKEKTLTVKLLPADCDTRAVFDPHRIAQVIINLLGNAIKFSPEGKQITIGVNEELLHESVSTAIRQQTALHLTVHDEGMGIPEGELESIFDQFVQSSKTKSGAGGTGLGLAICRAIVQAHGGKIWAQNTPNSGAVFNVLIPRYPASGAR